MTIGAASLAPARGVHRGEILAHDSKYVYQRTAAGILRHPHIPGLQWPEAGTVASIRYKNGQPSAVARVAPKWRGR